MTDDGTGDGDGGWDDDGSGDDGGDGTGGGETGGGLDDGEPDTTGADGGPPACNDETFELTVEPPRVMLVLDKSESMVLNTWDHDQNPGTAAVTRWNSLHAVVDELAHTVEDDVELGMVLFPSASLTETDAQTACTVEPEPDAPAAPSNADAIVGALPEADSTEIYGGTPASAGLGVALDHLMELDDDRSQAIVLVTDGAANCMAGTSGDDVFTQYDDDLVALVSQVYDEGIPTYVVGVDIRDEVGSYPVANAHDRLSELATAGGVPQQGADEPFYNSTDEDQLLTALDQIASELSCTIELSTPAQFGTQLTVAVGEMDIPQVDQCPPSGKGWRFVQDQAPYQSLELCAASCDLARIVTSLDVEYQCPPEG